MSTGDEQYVVRIQFLFVGEEVRQFAWFSDAKLLKLGFKEALGVLHLALRQPPVRQLVGCLVDHAALPVGTDELDDVPRFYQGLDRLDELPKKDADIMALPFPQGDLSSGGRIDENFGPFHLQAPFFSD